MGLTGCVVLLLAMATTPPASMGTDTSTVSHFLRQTPRPGVTIEGAPPVLFVNRSDARRQVALVWKKPPDPLLREVMRIAAGPSDSCLVEWRTASGDEVREYWPVDRGSGVLVCPHPRSWYRQTFGLERWGFRCASLGVLSTGGEYAPGHLDQAIESMAAEKPVVPDTAHVTAAESTYADQLPEPTARVGPEYPEDARNRHEEGRVVIAGIVGVDGRIHTPVPVESIPDLDQAAIDAIAQWRFRPASVFGRPRAVWVAIPLNFSLH